MPKGVCFVVLYASCLSTIAADKFDARILRT
jgi:hypothetical protein